MHACPEVVHARCRTACAVSAAFRSTLPCDCRVPVTSSRRRRRRFSVRRHGLLASTTRRAKGGTFFTDPSLASLGGTSIASGQATFHAKEPYLCCPEQPSATGSK